MQWSIEKIIHAFFRRWYGSEANKIEQLPPSGSSRQYFRIMCDGQSWIAAFNPDSRENVAFLSMSRHFAAMGLPVPRVLAEEPDSHIYLVEDLGDTTLFSMLPQDHRISTFKEEVVACYKSAIEWLPVFQIKGAENFDFNICYPRKAFDRHSMMWDLNYFKYYFLKISGIPFDEQKLEDSFEDFITRLSQADGQHFMYRDFQSRNIMIRQGKPYFIDYQGGRQGPLQYDIASLLFDAKANIPFGLRHELLHFYLAKLATICDIDTARFLKYYYDYVLIRVMQALATYGFRGGVEKKPVFLQSMPYALNNLKWLAENDHLPTHNPYICSVIEKTLSTLPIVYRPAPSTGMTVTIKSFSFRKGIPVDYSGNGGGFVFDCRILPNPGRIDSLKHFTGLDAPVIDYLDSQPAVIDFLSASQKMVFAGIDTYLEKDFDHLSVCFGCTGGKHRSVYCAERLATAVKKKYRVNVDLQHEEEGRWTH